MPKDGTSAPPGDNPPSSRLSKENERVGKAENNVKINYYCNGIRGLKWVLK
jgi:hypothetical protein